MTNREPTVRSVARQALVADALQLFTLPVVAGLQRVQLVLQVVTVAAA